MGNCNDLIQWGKVVDGQANSVINNRLADGLGIFFGAWVTLIFAFVIPMLNLVRKLTRASAVKPLAFMAGAQPMKAGTAHGRVQTDDGVTSAFLACPECSIEEMTSANPKTLYAVSVDKVWEALQACGEQGVHRVMTQLWKSHEFLACARTEAGQRFGKLAIISYRVVGGADGFTFDAHAFLSIICAARLHNVDFLWLDCWAYRKQLPWAEYEHVDFMTTLSVVMLSVDLVIWLPRSRQLAPGEYQSRVWCSFEAGMVRLRRVPVVVAGHGLDGMQRAISAWGSLLVVPPWWSSTRHGPVATLGKLNLAFYSFVLTELCKNILWPLFFFPHYNLSKSIALRNLSIEVPDETGGQVLHIVGQYVMILWFFFLWAWARQLGSAVVVASNGYGVLNSMIAAANGEKSDLDLRSLSRHLPWLPAYDRRDILTVKTIFDAVAVHAALDVHLPCNNLDAVALSVYYSAILQPAPGDGVRGRTLRTWLSDYGLFLYQGVQRTIVDELFSDESEQKSEERGAATEEGAAPDEESAARAEKVKEELATARWLDAVPPMAEQAAEPPVEHSRLSCLSASEPAASLPNTPSASRPRESHRTRTAAPESARGPEGGSPASSSVPRSVSRSNMPRSSMPRSSMPRSSMSRSSMPRSSTASSATSVRLSLRSTRPRRTLDASSMSASTRGVILQRLSTASCLSGEALDGKARGNEALGTEALGAEAVGSEAPADDDRLLVGELTDLSWQLGLGVHDLVTTPAGSFWVRPHQRIGSSTLLDIHGIARVQLDEAFVRWWPVLTRWVLHIATVPILFQYVYYLYISVAYTIYDSAFVVFGVLDPWLALCESWVHAAVFAGPFMAMVLAKLGRDVQIVCHQRRGPKPVDFAASTGYLLQSLILAGFFIYVIQRSASFAQQLLQAEALIIQTFPDQKQCIADYPTLVVIGNLASYGFLPIFALWEAALCTINVTATMCRHRNLRYGSLLLRQRLIHGCEVI